MSESIELLSAHNAYIKARESVPDIRTGGLSISIGCIAYGKASNISDTYKSIEALEKRYKAEIKAWKESLDKASECLAIRNK